MDLLQFCVCCVVYCVICCLQSEMPLGTIRLYSAANLTSRDMLEEMLLLYLLIFQFQFHPGPSDLH